MEYIETLLKNKVKSFLINYFPEYYLSKRSLRRSNFEKELKFVEILCDSSKCSIDIGADMGLYTYHLSNFSNKVFVFEPIIETFTNLEKLFKKRENVFLHNLALSNDSGTTEMRIPQDENGRSTIDAGNSLTDVKGEIVSRTVEMKTLDSFKFTNVGFMKIDVEGHELSVLEGSLNLLKENHPNLLIEIEERHKFGTLKKTVNFLDKLNYSCFFLADRLRNFRDDFTINKYQNEGSNFYVNNFIFLNNLSQTESIIKKLNEI